MDPIWSASSLVAAAPWFRRAGAGGLGSVSIAAAGSGATEVGGGGAGGGVIGAVTARVTRGGGGGACRTRVPTTAPATTRPTTPAEIHGQTTVVPAAAFETAAPAASVFTAPVVTPIAAVTPSALAIRADAVRDGPFSPAARSNRRSKSVASAASSRSGRSAGGRFMIPLLSADSFRRAPLRRGTV